MWQGFVGLTVKWLVLSSTAVPESEGRCLCIGFIGVSYVLLEWVVFYWSELCFTCAALLHKQTASVFDAKLQNLKMHFFVQKHKKLLHKKTPDRSRIQNDKMNGNYLNHPQQRPLQAAVWNGAHGLGLAWLMLANTQWKSQKTQHSDQFLCLQKPKPVNLRLWVTTEARHGGSSTALLASANTACQNISSLSEKSLHNKSYKNKAILTWKMRENGAKMNPAGKALKTTRIVQFEGAQCASSPASTILSKIGKTSLKKIQKEKKKEGKM